MVDSAFCNKKKIKIICQILENEKQLKLILSRMNKQDAVCMLLLKPVNQILYFATGLEVFC